MNKNMKYVKYESFNPDAMRFLLSYVGIPRDIHQQLQKYFKRRERGNCVQTTYDWCKEYATYQVGRVYVAHSLGLQGFERDIRNALAQGFYWDLDMVNAHPSILLQVCKSKGWICTNLEHYVNNRADVLNEISSHYGCSMKDAKNLIIRMMFLGFPESWVGDTVCENSTDPLPFISTFKDELQNIAKNVWASCTDISDIVKRKKKKTEQQKIASCLSLFLQTEEHKVLMSIDEALRMQNRSMDTYIYDGGLVRRLPDEEELPESVIIKCEEHVKNITGYEVKLVVKDLKTTFTSFMEIEDKTVYSYMKKDFELTHFKVMRPVMYVEILDNGDFYIRDESEMKKAFRHLKTIKDEKGMDFITPWMDDPNIKTYDTIDFLPPPLVCPENTFNMWKGFAIEHKGATNSGNIEPFLEHSRILVNHDEKSLHYLLCFLAQIVQSPGTTVGTALLFKSEQGAGKNVFIDFLTKMLGEDLCYETANPVQDLWSRFSLGRKNRILINVDETSGKDTYQFAEQLKNMITSKTLNYEKKGIDPITLRNFNRLIFTTNNANSLKIEQGDRRYAVFECSNEKKGNKKYFDDLVAYFDEPDNQKAVFEYLKDYNISNVDWINDRPITELYKNIQESSLPIHIKFFMYMYENNGIDYKMTYTPNDFYQYFKQTMTSNGHSVDGITNTKFIMSIKQHIKQGADGDLQGDEFIRKVNATKGFLYRLTINDVKRVLLQKGYIKETQCMIQDFDDEY